MTKVVPFEEFLDRYKGMIYNAITRWKILDHERDDAFQEVVIQLFKDYPGMCDSGAGKRDFEAWKTACAKRSIIKALSDFCGFSHVKPGKNNSAKMREATAPAGDFFASTGKDDSGYRDNGNAVSLAVLLAGGVLPSAEDQYLEALDSANIWAVVDSFTASQRDCLTLKYYNGMDNKSISSKLGVTTKQVETALSNGLANLRKHYGVEYAGKRGAPKGSKVGEARK